MSDTEKVVVEFTLPAGKRELFERWLKVVTDGVEADTEIPPCPVTGYRADDYVGRREALTKFVDMMEQKLRKNDHKTTWREKPVEALVRLMLLEIEEFKVADEFFSIAEARGELIDIANFALIVWDRLGMLDQDTTRTIQTKLVKDV